MSPPPNALIEAINKGVDGYDDVLALLETDDGKAMASRKTSLPNDGGERCGLHVFIETAFETFKSDLDSVTKGTTIVVKLANAFPDALKMPCRGKGGLPPLTRLVDMALQRAPRDERTKMLLETVTLLVKKYPNAAKTQDVRTGDTFLHTWFRCDQEAEFAAAATPDIFRIRNKNGETPVHLVKSPERMAKLLKTIPETLLLKNATGEKVGKYPLTCFLQKWSLPKEQAEIVDQVLDAATTAVTIDLTMEKDAESESPQKNLQKEIDELKKTIADLKSNAEKETSKYQEELATVKSKVTESEKAIVSANDELAAAKSAATESNAAKETMAASLKTAQEELAAAKTELDETKETKETMAISLKTAQEELAESNKVKDSSDTSLKSAQEELAEVKEAKETMAASLKTAQEELAETKEAKDSLDTSLKSTQAELAAANEAKAPLTTSLKTTQEEVAEVKKAKETMANSLKSAQDELAETKEAKESLASSLKSAQEELACDKALEHAKEELTAAKTEIKEAHEAKEQMVASLQKELGAATVELASVKLKFTEAGEEKEALNKEKASQAEKLSNVQKLFKAYKESETTYIQELLARKSLQASTLKLTAHFLKNRIDGIKDVAADTNKRPFVELAFDSVMNSSDADTSHLVDLVKSLKVKLDGLETNFLKKAARSGSTASTALTVEVEMSVSPDNGSNKRARGVSVSPQSEAIA